MNTLLSYSFPDTDDGRLQALSSALSEAEQQFSKNILSYKTHYDAEILFQQFSQLQNLYTQFLNNESKSRDNTESAYQTAKIYLTHFIQVLNMSVLRGEIPREQKLLYELDPDSPALPPLEIYDDFVLWGKRIISGEQARIGKRGTPIYNPPISKVIVFYEIFADLYAEHKLTRVNTQKYYKQIECMRTLVDRIIQDIWQQVSDYCRDLPPEKFTAVCKKFGVIATIQS
jgi:hypothetical protein